MSPKLFVVFLILGIVVMSVQAGGRRHKDNSNESKEKSNESKSKDSKENSKSKSNESNSNESKPDDDCNEPPIKPPPPKKCGPNEVWNNCGTACPLTCDKPKPGPCILKCVAGCQCKEGLLRNKWGKCVEPCDC